MYDVFYVETKTPYLFNTAGLVCRVYIFRVFKKQLEALQKTQRISVCTENENNIPLLTEQISFCYIKKMQFILVHVLQTFRQILGIRKETNAATGSQQIERKCKEIYLASKHFLRNLNLKQNSLRTLKSSYPRTFESTCSENGL